MSFLAEAELTIVAPAPRVFDRLADLASWPSWMPGSFVPVAAGHEASPLRLGDRFRVRVAEAPFATTLRVSVLERPRELGWRGGLRGVLWAEHRFVLEPMGDERTRVRSIETWHGPLALVARRFVQPLAEKIGAAQLAGLAKAASLPR